MAHSYKFALIRLSSGDARDERLNVGLAVFLDDQLDVRLASRLDKVRALSAALDPAEVKSLVLGISELDQRLLDTGIRDVGRRIEMIGQGSRASFSSFGEFSAPNAGAYEEQVSSILRALVEPEPAPKVLRVKRSRLLTQVKQTLRSDRVLAVKGEDLSSHRVVPNLELENGLVADLALKNGCMHIIETVDATGGEEALRKAISEIAVSALVLDRARIKYGEKKTTTKLVYSASASLERVALPSLRVAEHQGAELVNWASANDRRAFLGNLSSLATPVPSKRQNAKRVAMGSGSLL